MKVEYEVRKKKTGKVMCSDRFMIAPDGRVYEVLRKLRRDDLEVIERQVPNGTNTESSKVCD